MQSEKGFLKNWLKDRIAIEKAVADISRMFLSHEGTDLKEVLSIIGKASLVDRARIVGFKQNAEKADRSYEWCESKIRPLRKDKESESVLHEWLIKRFTQGMNVMISDVEALSPEILAENNTLKKLNIRSLLAIPIYSTFDSIVGYIAFETIAKPREWLGEEVQSLRIIAEMVSLYWERLNALQALKKSEEKYRVLYEESLKAEEVYRSLITSSVDAIVINDMEDKVRFISPSFTELFGWTLEDVTGRTIPYIPESEKEKSKHLAKEILENDVKCQAVETKRITKLGQTLDISLSAFRYNDHGKKPAGIVYTLRDISDKKKLEAQLIQAQKMEAIGTLAGGIAHDFNNNLQAIFGCVEILRMTKEEGHPDHDKLATIEKSAQRASNLSKRLLVFSSDMENRLESVDINKEVVQVSKILERTIPKMISIELDLDENGRYIRADSGQLEQIIMNLAVNSRDALADGGKLTFRTRLVALNENHRPVSSGFTPGEYMLLTVSDNGTGMEPEVLDHIFEPFFSTKKRGEGTGLGLAMAYGIVKSHNGHITCKSKPGEGTTFDIYFPVISDDSQPKDREIKGPSSVEGGDETILIVDDEQTNRDLGEEILTAFGYNVLTASNDEEAITFFMNRISEIDLIILDLIMPGRGGKKLLEDLLRIDPRAKVLISSGYTERKAPDGVLDSGAVDFIRKPYEMNKMLKTVRKVLDKSDKNN